MSSSTWYSSVMTSSPHDDERDYAFDAMLPGERIGQPLAQSRRKAKLRSAIFLAILGGGGWALLGSQGALEHLLQKVWLSPVIAAVLPSADHPSMEKLAPGPTESVPSAVTAKDAEPATEPVSLKATVSSEANSSEAPPNETTAAAKDAAPAGDAPVETAVLPPAAANDEAQPQSAPLPLPKLDPKDPYQKRAAAVGLHPELSHVLLARLSPADYRNAGVAIKSALAEPSDETVFVWPRQHKPELAVFEVHFVPGAAPDCRRYVVTVTKDGWLTTALPMETCGAELKKSRRG